MKLYVISDIILSFLELTIKFTGYMLTLTIMCCTINETNVFKSIYQLYLRI